MTTSRVATHCIMDCPDLCSLEVEVEDGRVAALRGTHENPDTQGFMCAKVARFGERVEHPDRLLHPMVRSGPKGSGAFERVSWDEALERIARRFREIRERSGGEAILGYHYGGSNGLLGDELFDDLFFYRLGASRMIKTICTAPTSLAARAMYGRMTGVGYTDFPEARAIVVWGANPKVSGIHLVPYLKEAKKRGAFVAAVDPLKNFSDREVDLYLPVRPGADLPLALGMIHRWAREGRLDDAFLAEHTRHGERLLAAAEAWPEERAAREAGVPADDLRRLADAYAEASPALLRIGWGLERNRNGTRAVAALLAMPALLGKFGVRGGGYTLSNHGGLKFDPWALAGIPDDWDGRRVINMVQLGRLLTGGGEALGVGGPPIEGLFVYNSNPVATTPDQNEILRGLAREDLFTVVFEQVHTDTAAWADVLLPATTFLEQREIRYTYGSYNLGGIQPAVEPRGEARTNQQVFSALGRALGFEDEAFGWSAEEAVRQVARATRLGRRTPDGEALLQGSAEPFAFGEAGGRNPVQMVDVLPETADGLIDMAPDAFGEEPYLYHPADREEAERYPLVLLTPSSSKQINSTLGEFNRPRFAIALHPEDAAARSLSAGDPVKVWNDRGELICPLEISEQPRPGTALLPKGAWRKASETGATANALCPDHVEELSGGACFSDARVQVARAEA